MKPYSIALSTTACGPIRPTAFTIASFSPVCLLRLAQPLLVRLHIGKIQRIGRAQPHIHQLIARLQQQLNSLPRAKLEMVLALRAHVLVRFKIRPENWLAAARALDPQSLGANRLPGRIRAPLSGPGPDSYSPFSRLNQDIPNPIVNGVTIGRFRPLPSILNPASIATRPLEAPYLPDRR